MPKAAEVLWIGQMSGEDVMTTEVQPVQRIMSAGDPQRVLHVVVRTHEITGGRLNVSDPQEWLQMSVLQLSPTQAMVPHYHHGRPPEAPAAAVTQETWIVMRGGLDVRLFDENHQLVESTHLGAGDLLATFGGGHAFDRPEPATVIVECKNGPYLGRDYTPIAE